MKQSTRFTMCMVVATLAFGASIAPAQGNKGGGTVTNNVIAAFDEASGTLTITGNSADNLFYVEVWNSTIYIGQGPWNQTTINGQNGSLTFLISSQHLNVVIDAGLGNDRIWIKTSQTDVPLNFLVRGADGADEIAVSRALQSPFLDGSMSIEGGKGDDAISLIGVYVTQDLTIAGGDNNDTVSIVDSTWNGGSAPEVLGVSILDGGRGRDRVSSPAYFLNASFVSGFESVVIDP